MSHDKPFGDLVKFASRNSGEGVLIEPRWFFDFLNFAALPTGTTVCYNSDPGALTNGEQFPVRLTHMIVSPLHLVEDVVDWTYVPPSAVQDLFLRVERYGEYYMNEQFIRASAWHNCQTGQPYNFGAGGVTTRFFQPLVLSSRDSLRVEFESVVTGTIGRTLAIPAPNARNVQINQQTNDPATGYTPPQLWVQFTGVGMRSGRPYYIGGQGRPSNNGNTVFLVDPANLQNIGNEPIALVSMTCNANTVFFDTTGDDTSGLLPDTRFYRVQIRQQGNGTQSDWCSGPKFPTAVQRMPLALLGTTLGDAVVHKFPGDGITLDPSEVVRVSAVFGSVLSPQASENQFAVGFAGYLMLT